MKNKNIVLIIVIILILVLIGGLVFGYYKKFIEKKQNPIVTMEVEEYGTIKIELYPDEAPNTVANFVRLSNRGFYDGLTFHRVIKDFMIQGGDKLGNGTGSPVLSDIRDDIEVDSDSDKAYAIKGEFIYNGVNNKIKFEKGILAMARGSYTAYSSNLTTESYNSAGSQFFITTEPSTNLNGTYCAFGKVIEGMDVVEKIANTEIKKAEEGEEATSTEESTPVNPPVIKSIRVETFGLDYGIPETLDVFDLQSWYMKQYGIG